MVSLARKMGIYPSGALTVVEQEALWCDDNRKVEWEKQHKAQCVPRLEGMVGSDTIVLTSPQAIVRTLLDQYGEGLLEPGTGVRAALRAKFVEALAEVWARLMRQASEYLFSFVWDHGNVPQFETMVQTMQWTDRCLVPIAVETRQQGRVTVLDILAGSALALLLASGSYVVEEALRNLGGLKKWANRAMSDPSVSATMHSLKSHPNKEQYQEYCVKNIVRCGEGRILQMFSGQRNMGFYMGEIAPTLAFCQGRGT
uniref:Uncharacterized protein n=1 Tax=Hemiselmis andersenii TaxID=464988 RepID=A0A7S1E9D6_HEMAN